jgi:ABC-type polysaccharide/polyol phosphate export permease
MGKLRELLSYRDLIKNLVFKDLKLKYRNSVLGFLWSLLNPMMLLIMYTVAFKYIMRAASIENYTYFLMVGLLPWTFFVGSVLGSTMSIIASGGLIKKVYFPREVLPISKVLFCLAQWILAMMVFLPALVVLGHVPVRWPALLFVPILVLHVLFTIGVGLVLAAVTPTFRDISHFVELALQMMFWATPIVYQASQAPPRIQVLFQLSPLAAFTTAYQDVLFLGVLPATPVLASTAAWAIIALVVGHVVFQRYDDGLAEAV